MSRRAVSSRRRDAQAWYGPEASGIDDFRWCELRHTWANRQVQAGTPSFALQEMGGPAMRGDGPSLCASCRGSLGALCGTSQCSARRRARRRRGKYRHRPEMTKMTKGLPSASPCFVGCGVARWLFHTRRAGRGATVRVTATPPGERGERPARQPATRAPTRRAAATRCLTLPCRRRSVALVRFAASDGGPALTQRAATRIWPFIQPSIDATLASPRESHVAACFSGRVPTTGIAGAAPMHGGTR